MIYLSICIPTYNRCDILKSTIYSIISQSEFTNSDEVEIVVSDNCSTDGTQVVMQQFLADYPSKMKYNRNDQNLLDGNFEKVLKMGSGKILKLNNDTLPLNPGGLAKMLRMVKYCDDRDLIPFFLNRSIPSCKKNTLCKDPSSFVYTVSYWCTWIGSFSISKKAFDQINDFSRNSALMLVQVDILLRLLQDNYSILVIPEKFSTPITPTNKGGYNLTKVFLINYFTILGRYLTDNKGISVLKKEKKKILYKFILPFLVNIKMDLVNKTSKFDFNPTYKPDIKSEFSYLTYFNFEFWLKMRTSLSCAKSSLKKHLRYQ